MNKQFMVTIHCKNARELETFNYVHPSGVWALNRETGEITYLCKPVLIGSNTLAIDIDMDKKECFEFKIDEEPMIACGGWLRSIVLSRNDKYVYYMGDNVIPLIEELEEEEF